MFPAFTKAATSPAYRPQLRAMLLGCAGAAMLSISASAGAQAVVQPIPPAEARNLSEALNRLARNPRDLSALIAAGNASLQVDDIDAAIGFFGRADDLSAGDARVKAGLGAAYARQGRPIEALGQFDLAQAAGGASATMAGDRGLAYDLIGDPSRAQEEYGRALANGRNAEIVRRLALSHAISGDKRRFERTLRPLLDNRDFGAFRTRAFGLAILGEADAAIEIARAVMPSQMADRLVPYFRLMPQLTAAQQAAAANIGQFPAASAIGRDDPRFAAARGSGGRQVAAAQQARLEPAGPQLGSRGRSGESASSVRRRPRQQDQAVTQVRRRPGQAASAVAERRNRRNASDPLARAQADRRARVVRREAAAPEPTPAPAVPVTSQTAAQTPAQTAPAPARGTEPVVAAANTSPASSELPAVAPIAVTEVRGGTPVGPPDTRASAVPPPAPAPASTVTPSATIAQPVVQAAPQPASTAAAAPEPASPSAPAASVSDAFADLATPIPQGAATATTASGAVDITAIEPRREVEAAPPAHPSRIWVQVATGRDRSALRFDWRRLARTAPGVLEDKGPFVASWNATNRLLAGPFDNAAAARSAIADLREAGVDSFAFTSADGEAIEVLRQ